MRPRTPPRPAGSRSPARSPPHASLRDLEDDGTAFSAARRLGQPDLDALYESVGRGDLTTDELLAALALEPVEAASPSVLQ